MQSYVKVSITTNDYRSGSGERYMGFRFTGSSVVADKKYDK